MAKEQTGISGEFWFISQLHRLGYESYITLGNTKSIDIAVNLSNKKILTFDVKSKMNFNGCVPDLKNVPVKKNHYVVFIDLNILPDKTKGKIKLLDNPSCYIVDSNNIKELVHDGGKWGLTFEAKLLWYLKFKCEKSITADNIDNFKSRHSITGDIDFKKYNRIILTLEEFENKYYKWK